MAITKIAGELLESNLIRVQDLSFSGGNPALQNLLHVDVTNGRIGVKTDSPGNFALDVNGATRIQGDLTVTGTTTTIDSQNLTVEDNIITLNENASGATDAGIMINRTAQDNAVFFWDETDDVFKVGITTGDGSTRTDLGDIGAGVTLAKLQVATPQADKDASTKKYVDDSVTSLSGTLSSNLSSAVAAVTGMDTDLSTPDDSTFGDGALTSLTSTTKVTDAIDGLNETMENIRNSTYVKSVTYTANPTAGSLGTTVALNISPIGGGANRYDVDWGDGTAVQTVTTTTPTHDYDENSGQPYTISVKAYNNTAVSGSSGSFANSGDSQTNQVITVYTSQPIPAFAIYAAASGGSPITTANSGATVYLQNNTTNVAGATTTYNIDWGDTTENDVTGDNGVAGGSSTNGGTRLAHTYNNSANDDGSTVAGTGTGDTKYQIKLRLLTHTTADPAVVPAQATSNFEVYSAHTAAYSAAGGVVRGINEESTSGFPVTFTNNTATLPGSNSSFSATQRYTWNFDEGSTTNVNVGSGSSGDTGNTINNTFNLSGSEQSNGTTVTYNTSLSLANGHTGSPSTANLNIIVEPDVRANIAGTAVTVSTGSGNNSLSLFDVTDLDGANRALARFTNTSQNADHYEYDFLNDSSAVNSVPENGSDAGTVGNTLDHNYSGQSAGSIVMDFRATGTPDTIHQGDNETVTFTMKATPSAPANLSSKSLTLNHAADGTLPKLCHGFTDNTSSFTSQSPGDSLNTTTARRYVEDTIDTNTVTNFLTNNSNGTGSTVNQTLTAKINNASKGARTFTTSEGGANNTTDDTLVITNHRDYDEVDSSYAQRLYLVATAKITEALTDYSIGSNAQRLESSAGGNTNIVHVVRDDVTAVPTTAIGTVTEGTAGSKRYISGIPYYNTGSPTVTVTGTTIANFTGQAYQDTNSPHQVHNDTNQESTSGDAITDSAYTYAQVDGATTMLSGSTPKTDIGVSSAYTIGAVTVPITSSSVKSIKTIRARSKNANGTGSYNSSSTKIQVYTATVSGLDNEAGGITVSDSLGNGSTHTDDALRISGFGSSSDTPSFNSATNYYTSNAWSGAVTVAGTTEAISRFGTIKHFTTDLSSGYLPVGPDLNTSRNGGEAQYYTFAFRRTPASQFSITMSGKVSGMFLAVPGTAIDSASDANGWLDCSTQYNGSGVPGVNTNGSNGCAKTGGDRVVDNTTYSSEQFTFTLGTESTANSVGNTVLVRIKLNSGDSVTALSVGVAE